MACTSDAFGIDNDHWIPPLYTYAGRSEAFIGWTEKSAEILSDAFALEFWMVMGSGMTVTEAIDYIKAVDNIIFDKTGIRPFESNNIKWIDKNSATLVP